MVAPTEHCYAHLDKETLVIIIGLKHYNQRRHFVIYSDHKIINHCCTYLFSATKPTPIMWSAWIQRWALTISSYDYEIQYRRGSQQATADGCNRVLLSVSPQEIPILVKQSSNGALRHYICDSKTCETSDTMWSSTLKSIANCPSRLVKTSGTWTQSFVHHCYIMWGHWVNYPPQGRQQLSDKLHVAHSLSSFIKWPCWALCPNHERWSKENDFRFCWITSSQIPLMLKEWHSSLQ